VTPSADVLAGEHRFVDHRYASPECRTLISRPGDAHATLVDEAGRLIQDHRPAHLALEGSTGGHRRRLVRFGLSSGEPPVEVEQFIDDARVPIVTTILRYSQYDLELVVCGHVDSERRRLDVVRWRLFARHGTPEPHPAFQIEFRGEDADQPVIVGDAPLVATTPTDPHMGSAVRAALDETPTEVPATGVAAFLLDGPPIEGNRLSADWADEALASERQFWEAVALQLNELLVPDRGIMQLFEASARRIAQGHRTPEGLVQSGARVAAFAQAAALLGLDDQAHAASDEIIRGAQLEGHTTGSADHVDVTVVAIAAICRHGDLAGTLSARETDTLRRWMGEMRQHHEPGPAALWALAAATIVGRSQGVPADVQATATQLAGALRDNLRTTGAAGLTDGDPEAQRALAYAIYPGEAFAPDDAVVIDLVRELDAIEEAVGGEPAVPSAEVWLYAGAPDKAIDRLYDLANHAGPTGGWPQASASAEFVRAVRNLLVFERGNELELLGGLPPTWLMSGAQIVVERTPTRFGPISLRMSVDDGNVARIELEADWSRPPERIVLRPPAATVSARIDGRAIDDNSELLVMPVARRVNVTLGLRREYATVTGHSAVKAALRDWHGYSSATPFKPDIRIYRQLPIESDPPAHSDYRAILTPFFSRQRVVEVEPRIRTVARDLVARFESVGTTEAVHDLALPIVVHSLGILLGRPQDADEWLSWGLRNNEPHGRRDSRRTDAYLARVFDEGERRRGHDAFSHIARAEIDGRPLTRLERLGVGNLLLSAGRAAAVNLICGAIWHLAGHPAARDELAADLSRVPSALEEYLRFLSPVPQMPRLAAGQAGGKVALSFLSANHDATVFNDPGRIDFDRRPNHHVAFGNGPHTCIGAHLGKLEARVLIEELLSVVPNFRPDGAPDVDWQDVAGIEVPGEFMSLPIAAER